MSRPVTLFTGQWADLPLDELAARCAGWGFDGLELACWGDHFEVDKAIADAGYISSEYEGWHWNTRSDAFAMVSRHQALIRRVLEKHAAPAEAGDPA